MANFQDVQAVRDFCDAELQKVGVGGPVTSFFADNLIKMIIEKFGPQLISYAIGFLQANGQKLLQDLVTWISGAGAHGPTGMHGTGS